MDINQLYAEFCNKFWIYFLGMESAQGRKTATFLKWKKRIPAVRKAMLQFLNEHGAPDKSPLFWVQDFPEPVPTNYNGKDIPGDKEMFIALYKGQAGIYSREDVEDYEMTIKKRFTL
jgi:hypothetical protein